MKYISLILLTLILLSCEDGNYPLLRQFFDYYVTIDNQSTYPVRASVERAFVVDDLKAIDTKDTLIGAKSSFTFHLYYAWESSEKSSISCPPNSVRLNLSSSNYSKDTTISPCSSQTKEDRGYDTLRLQ